MFISSSMDLFVILRLEGARGSDSLSLAPLLPGTHRNKSCVDNFGKDVLEMVNQENVERSTIMRSWYFACFFLRITFVEQLYFVLQKIPALCRCRRPRIATWSWFVSWIDLKSAHSMNVKKCAFFMAVFIQVLFTLLFDVLLFLSSNWFTNIPSNEFYFPSACQPLCHFIILYSKYFSYQLLLQLPTKI